MKILKELVPPGIKSHQKKAENLQPGDGPGETPGNGACTLQGDLSERSVRVGVQRFIPQCFVICIACYDVRERPLMHVLLNRQERDGNKQKSEGEH